MKSLSNNVSENLNLPEAAKLFSNDCVLWNTKESHYSTFLPVIAFDQEFKI